MKLFAALLIISGFTLLLASIVIFTLELKKILENRKLQCIEDDDCVCDSCIGGCACGNKVENKVKGDGIMAETYEVKVYTKDDMMALDNMSVRDIIDSIEELDRGFFNRYLYPEFDDEYNTYSEDEYRDFKIRVALRKLYEYLDDLAEREESC